ncbi:hypothetical protein C8F01DRAFT_1242149 [Mycena amicta]|nr:hypothetical protein C8F01DRAFT_1242149 [Mycena amicta]
MAHWTNTDNHDDTYDAKLAAHLQQEEYERTQARRASTSKNKNPEEPPAGTRGKGKEKARDRGYSSESFGEFTESEPEYTRPWIPSPGSTPGANPLRMPAPHTFSAPLRTSLDMPIPGSKEAPKTFRGRYTEVERFIRHLEHLYIKNRVTDEKERCTLVLDYCSTNIQNVIQTMDYYRTPRWVGLRQEILRAFDAERTKHKYRPSDVVNLVKETTKESISSMTQWRKYGVRYNTIAGGLYNEGHLAENDYRIYFWMGIPRELRNSLEARILQGRSLQNTKAYSMREINTAAEWYFRRNRAEAMLLGAAEFGIDEYDGDEDSDSDSDATDSDSEYERRRSKKKKKRGSSATRKGKESTKTKTATTTRSKTKFAGNEEEIASMIKQLNGMKLEDPDYAPTYYKVLALDQTGNAAHSPDLDGDLAIPLTSPRLGPRSRQEPRHLHEHQRPLTQITFRWGRINELVARGILGHNAETRRLELRSGAPLRRLAGEWLLDAVERITKGLPKSSVMLTFTSPMTSTARAVQNFYQTQSRIRDLSTDESDSSQEDQPEEFFSTDAEDDDHTVYLSVPKSVQFDSRPAQIYEADRTVPSIRQARRMAFDGVEMPPRRHGSGPSVSPALARRTVSRNPPSKVPPSAPANPAPPTQDDPTSGKAEPEAQIRGARQPIRPPTPPLPHTKKPMEYSELAPVEARRPRHTSMEGIETEGAPPEGTYLVFKDPVSGRPRFEMLAAVAENDLEDPFVQYQTASCLHIEDYGSFFVDAEDGTSFENLMMRISALRRSGPDLEICKKKRELKENTMARGILQVLAVWIAYGVHVLFTPFVLLEEILYGKRNKHGHTHGCHPDPKTQTNDPERGGQPCSERAHDRGWSARNVDEGTGLRVNWSEPVDCDFGRAQDVVDASTRQCEVTGLDLGNEYKRTSKERAFSSPNSNPFHFPTQTLTFYWIPKSLTHTVHWHARNMDLHLPSTPPTQLISPPILAPPMYISPTHPRYPNDTTAYSNAEVTAVQVLTSMRERSLAYDTGRPTLLRQASGAKIETYSEEIDTRTQFSTHPLQRLTGSPMADDVDWPMGTRPIRPLPRRARLPPGTIRPPTPYPHLDETIVQAVQRTQIATIDGVVAAKRAEQATNSTVGRENDMTEVLDGAPADMSPTPQSAVFPSLSTPALASTSSTGETTSQESIGFRPILTFGEPSPPTTASVSQQIVQGLQQVGLPRINPPATQSLPLFLPIPEFDPTILAFLGHYLQGAPVLDELTRAVDKVRQLVPVAQQTETRARVLAEVLPMLQKRADEAQSRLEPDLVHGWVIFYEALRDAQEMLSERAQDQLEAAYEATAEYQACVARVNAEIDVRGTIEIEAHQLTRILLDPPSAASSVRSFSPLIDSSGPGSRDSMDGMTFDALDLGLLDAAMEEAQRELAAMRLVVGEENGVVRDDIEENDLTAERESEINTWEVHVHEASFWDFTPSTVSTSSLPETLGVHPLQTIGTRTPPSTGSNGEDDWLRDESALSTSSSSDSAEDEQVRQYLQSARDLGHLGRYDEAREYWWAALNGTDSDDDLSPLVFESAPSSPMPDSTIFSSGLESSYLSLGGEHGNVEELEDGEIFELESLIQPELIEDATGVSRGRQGVDSTTSFGHDDVDIPPPDYRQRIAMTFLPTSPPAVFEGKQEPRPWYRREPLYSDNNPSLEPYHNRPDFSELPKLKLSDYARVGAFEIAPLQQGLHKSARTASEPSSSVVMTPPLTPPLSPDLVSPPNSSTSMPQPFVRHIADLRRNIFPYETDSVGGKMFDELAEMMRALDVEHALAFSGLHKAVHLAYDHHGLGQLVDYERMREPNGQRVEFDWDQREQPIVVDAERDELKEHFFYGHHFDLLQAAYDLRHSLLSAVRLALPFLGRQGADLSHAFYKWLRTHSYATRRRYFWAFPLLRRHEMGLCETLYSLLIEHGYMREADELWRVLRVRYVCEDILGNFLRDGFLDITRQRGDAEYWTRDLPGIICDDDPLGDETTNSLTNTPSTDPSFSYFTGANFLDADFQYPSDEESDVRELRERSVGFSRGIPRSLPNFELTLPVFRRAEPARPDDPSARSSALDTLDTAAHDARTVDDEKRARMGDDGRTTL